MTINVAQTTQANRNNVVGPTSGTGFNYAATIDRATRTFQKFDFSMQWTGLDGLVEVLDVSGNKFPQVGLVPRTKINAGSPAWGEMGGDSSIPFYVEWVLGTIPGTIKERYFAWSALLLERDNVDPGFGAIHIQDSDPADAGRPGPRYSVVLAGSEYRVYVNQPGMGQRPIVIIANTAVDGYGPFSLHILGFASKKTAIRNIVLGADNRPSTIYSLREQIEDFGSERTKLFLRIYQQGRYPGIDGIYTDYETPTI